MLSIEDCVAMCGLSKAEIDAIAEHEHVPEIGAAALASYLLHKAGGQKIIRSMIVDDIREAVEAGRYDRASELLVVLRHFLNEHHAETVM